MIASRRARWARDRTTSASARGNSVLVSAVLAIALVLATVHNAAASPQERVYMRAGVLHMEANVNSGPVALRGVGGIAGLSVDNGPIEGSGVDMASVTIPAIITGYILPWWDGRVAVETILALPITLDLLATGTLSDQSLASEALGNIPTGVPPLGPNLGETKTLPPVVTVVYRFFHDKAIRPYLGAGAIALLSYDSKVTNEVLTEVSTPGLAIENAFGWVAQAGIEARFYERFFFNLDAKFIGGLSLTAVMSDIYVAAPGLPLFESIAVGDAVVDVSLNPLLFQVGLGMNY